MTEMEELKIVTETEIKREIVYTDENGTSKPITEKVIMPVIEGAIIYSTRSFKCKYKVINS